MGLSSAEYTLPLQRLRGLNETSPLKSDGDRSLSVKNYRWSALILPNLRQVIDKCE